MVSGPLPGRSPSEYWLAIMILQLCCQLNDVIIIKLSAKARYLP